MNGDPRLPARVVLRTEADADTPFLFALYASTRADELAQVDWTLEQKWTFVEMQFRAQREHYHREYPGARFEVIEQHGAAIGRLYVHERPDDIRVMDITLAPEARNQGIGAALLRSLFDLGTRTRRKVTIHVERHNPARRLYERLGFRPVGRESDESIYQLMEKLPDRATSE